MMDPVADQGASEDQAATKDQNTADAFWSHPDIVERFAGRAPDHRLMEMVHAWTGERPLRVLDLGCAGGRNTVALAAAGFDVHALDRSPAMVKRTQARVAEVLGPVEAERRVAQGSMEDLSIFEGSTFDWVVALGIFAAAGSRARWNRAVDEVARVTKPEGQVLVASFSPDSQPEGHPLERVSGEADVYRWRSGRRSVLLDPSALDEAFTRHGLSPEVPSETVQVPMDPGFRVTINARYRKAASG